MFGFSEVRPSAVAALAGCPRIPRVFKASTCGRAARLAEVTSTDAWVTVESSSDLGLLDPWSPWAVLGNHGIPLAPGLTNTLVAPALEPKRFFKIRIEEE